MEIEFFCPFCGNKLKIDVKNAFPRDVVCDLCGSSVLSQAKDAYDHYQTDQKGSSPGEPVGPLAAPKYQVPPAFPISQIAKNSGQTSKQFAETQMAPPPIPLKGQIRIFFPQFNQAVNIPSNEKEFHFGRNLILPLVNPNQYDVEFLNSISRIRTDDKGHFIGEHFILYNDLKGKFFIEDKNSKWGTWVNKAQIKGRGKVEIKKGDSIELMLSKPGVRTIFPLVGLFQT